MVASERAPRGATILNATTAPVSVRQFIAPHIINTDVSPLPLKIDKTHHNYPLNFDKIYPKIPLKNDNLIV